MAGEPPALLIELTHHNNLELLAGSLLLGDHVREAVHIVVEALEDGLLAVEPVLALLVDAVGDADDLISDFLLVPLLGLLFVDAHAGNVLVRPATYTRHHLRSGYMADAWDATHHGWNPQPWERFAAQAWESRAVKRRTALQEVGLHEQPGCTDW